MLKTFLISVQRRPQCEVFLFFTWHCTGHLFCSYRIQFIIYEHRLNIKSHTSPTNLSRQFRQFHFYWQVSGNALTRRSIWLFAAYFYLYFLFTGLLVLRGNVNKNWPEHYFLSIQMCLLFYIYKSLITHLRYCHCWNANANVSSLSLTHSFFLDLFTSCWINWPSKW